MGTQDIVRLATARTYGANGEGRRVRERALLSQGEVARAIGINQAILSRWEAGERRPTGAAALRWIELLLELERMLAAPERVVKVA